MHNRHLLARMLVILFAIALVFSACRGNSREKGEVSVDGRARMKVAIPRQPISATYYIAASQGFFAAEGLDVEIIETATGKEALQRVMSGEADLASTAETPVVHAVVNGEHLAVLATTATTRGALEIVARSDRGIREASDLAGRRVGVALGTNVEFFLDIFLTLHHVNRERMEIVDTDAADMLRGMTAGDLDAVVSWEPYTAKLRERLGRKAVFMTEPEIYSWYWNLVTNEEFPHTHAKATKAFLRALRAADRWGGAHPDRAIRMLASELELSNSTVKMIWENTRLSVTLDQALLLNLENQARWVMEKQSIASENFPDFLRVIAADPLRGLVPESVAIPGIGELP